MSHYKKTLAYGNHQLTLETGEIARQASGAVMVSLGDTMVLVTVCASKEAKEGQDFFPLQVEYRERTYAAGKIPGGFFKREGRPSEKAILNRSDNPRNPRLVSKKSTLGNDCKHFFCRLRFWRAGV